MKKLDRLGWAAGVSFVAFGVRVGIRVNDPAIMDQILPLLPPGWKPSPSPIVESLYSVLVGGAGSRPGLHRFHLVYSNLARLARTLDLDEALRLLQLDLHFYVGKMARRRLFVQAGVVGWQGRAIVLPGGTGSGKTSLVTALVKAGASYYSDEFAVVDQHGRVHPYAVPLEVRERKATRNKHTNTALGESPGIKPLPVGLIVLTKYKPGARWRPQAVAPAQAVLELLGHTLPARRYPELALTTLSKMVSQAQILKGVRGEAEEMARLLLNRLTRIAAKRP
jgi:hypothetical protein